MIRFAMDMMIATSSAVPKLAISKESPIILSVICNVMALMTNKNNPSVTNVTGSVRMIKIGRTSTFNIDRIKLAPIAAPKLDTKKDSSKKPAMATNKIAFINIPTSHLMKADTSISHVSLRKQLLSPS